MVPTHPTIVIGFGRYARTVMRRLLQEALDQGALVWDEPSKQEGPGSRVLRNVAFIHVSEEDDEDTPLTGDLARDLYRQIQEVLPDYQNGGAQGSLRYLVAAAVTAAKDRLLDASKRSAGKQILRVGLDVLILAQPNRPDSLGRLEDVLEPAMQALADDRSLERPAAGSSLLNFLLFLDFDNYWESSETHRLIRAGMQSSVERWHLRQLSGEPGFARIYLMDGQVKQEGRRSEALRIEELIILLCLMLFEDKRDDPGLRGLFEKTQDQILPVATFGVRALERRRDLLGLLAAAKFATGYLEYLMGNVAQGAKSKQDLHDQLAAFRPQSAAYSAARQDLDQIVAGGLSGIEEQAHSLSLSAEASDWRKEYSARLENSLIALRNRLSAWSGDYARMTSLHLANLSERLNQIVSAAIDDAAQPLPLGLVIQELLDLRRSLEVPALSAPAGSDFAHWDDLAAAHREFTWFRRSQLNPANLARWWPLLAATLAAAWTPVLLDALNAVPPPASTGPFLLRKAHEALMYFNRPILVVLIVTALAWWAGRKWFEPQIRKWVARGFLGWSHARQGMLSDRIRRFVRSGPVAEEVHANADYVFTMAVQRVNAEVRREIDRAVSRLRARGLEMQWLRNEMREFLRTHEIDPDAPPSKIVAGARSSSVYRVALDRQPDLQHTLALNPPNPERYQAVQAEKHPLRTWGNDYCDTFLDPVQFLEDLNEEYYGRRAEIRADRKKGTASPATVAEMAEFLDKSGQFSLAFDWSTAPGAVADVQSWCILPPEWRMGAEIVDILQMHAFIDQRIVTGSASDRAYFLKVQWGMSIDRLNRHEWQTEAPGA